MNNLLKITAATFLIIAVTTAVQAQKVALKTNLLYWGTGTVNLGTEIAVHPKMTVDFIATGNFFTFGPKAENRKLWHWSVQPEARYWFRESFNGGFLGVHATGASYSAGGIDFPLGVFPDFKNHRYEGWLGGLGVSYGYQWYISPHFNVEATFGFGYLYLQYNRFSPQNATAPEADQLDHVHHYFGPTKIGVTFSYLFRSKK